MGRRWVTTADLVAKTYELERKLPPQIDAVVGVPRSGMLPATIIALHRCLPLFSITQNGALHLGGGAQMAGVDISNRQCILLVEDTVGRGTNITEATAPTQASFPGARIIKAAVMVNRRRSNLVDFFADTFDGPEFEQWHTFTSKFVRGSAFDLDGVLCHDLGPRVDDNEEVYIQAITNAIPFYRTSDRIIGAIVTGRLEKYRPQTVSWLTQHGFRYRHLFMGPWPSVADRGGFGRVGRWKASVYNNMHGLGLFVESDDRQAQVIASYTNKQVLCPTVCKVWH